MGAFIVICTILFYFEVRRIANILIIIAVATKARQNPDANATNPKKGA